jgi:hypothetical protein
MRLRYALLLGGSIAIGGLVHCVGDDPGATGDPTNEAGTDVADDTSTTDTGAPDATQDAAPCLTCERTIFLLQTTSNGAMGGVDGADARCQAAANASGRPGVVGKTFRAWLSGGGETAAQRHVHSNAAYAMPNGVIVAADWNELVTTGPRVPIHVYEDGGAVQTGARFVWSGTAPNGAGTTRNCGSWTSADPTLDASVGQTNLGDGGWTATALRDCGNVAHLYCIER